ncbi:MAG TPA: ATP-binding protein [Polyangiaceae bacterium]
MAGSVRQPSSSRSSVGYFAALAVVGLSSSIGWFVFGQSEIADVAMALLLGVVVVSTRFGHGPSLLAATLSAFVFEFCFLPPYFSLAISNLRHIVTFAVMLVVAFVISHLSKRVHDQADAARDNERRTASLYAVSRELGLAVSLDEILLVAARHLRELFDARAAILLPTGDDQVAPAFVDWDLGGASGEAEEQALEPSRGAGTLSREVREMALWTWRRQLPAGVGTAEFPGTRARVVPLLGSRGAVGVLALFPSWPMRMDDPVEQELLDALAGVVGLALERTRLAEQARRAALWVETEQLRDALLSSVSHDLRTPLAVVTGATSALLAEFAPRDEKSRRTLLETAHREALRLNRLVRNLLDMARVEGGALRVRKDPQPLEEVIGAALHRLEDRLRGRDVETSIPADLPLVPFDSVLVEQVLVNLLENATKYTPEGSPIDVSAVLRDGEVETAVGDRGPGVAPSEVERVFEKFYRSREGEGGGVGLGLPICRGIVGAHGGRIWVADRPGGGASFHFTLPMAGGEARV